MGERKRQWLAVWLPPAVWAVQVAFGWFAGAHACSETSPWWSVGTARVLIGIVTLVALAVSVGALAYSRRQHDSTEKAGYLSYLALVVGGTLTLGALFGALPELLIGHCGRMR